MIKDVFVKIDKEFFNNLSSKELLILLYLYNKSRTLQNFSFTLKDLISYYGFKPNPRKNQINESFIQGLNDLIHKKIITLNTTTIKNINQIIVCSFVFDDNYNTYFDNLDEFISCYNSEVDIIRQAVIQHKTLSTFERILAVFLYLKKFLNVNNPLKYSYPSLNTMMQDLNLSKPTILKAITDLENLNFIYKKNIGNYIDSSGKIYICNNVYCFEDYDINDLKQVVSSSLYKFNKWY